MSRLTATTLCAVAILLVTHVSVPAQSSDKDNRDKDDKKDPKRPSLTLKATPGTGMVPVRVSATAEFKGGDDDFQEYYCAGIEWNWGDGTVSEAPTTATPTRLAYRRSNAVSRSRIPINARARFALCSV